MTDQPGTLLEAPPLAILGLLDHLRARHGSIEGYAWSIGLSGQVIDGLHTSLVD
jgi:hypothetical protein